MSNELVYQDQSFGMSSVLSSDQIFERMMKIAEVMASSTVTVPKHLQKSVGDCMAIVMQASQWKMNPFAVAQKTHLVNGVLGYEAQLVNAVVSSSGVISGSFKYEFKGDGATLECRVGATLKQDQEVTFGEWLSISSVTTKNSPLWKTNPKQQLAYLQVKNWARLYAPATILGVYSVDEIDSLPKETIDITDTASHALQDQPPKQAQPTPYSFAELQANLPKWKDLIDSGKATANAIITAIEKGGRLLSDDQKMEIAELEAIEASYTVDQDTGEIKV